MENQESASSGLSGDLQRKKGPLSIASFSADLRQLLSTVGGTFLFLLTACVTWHDATENPFMLIASKVDRKDSERILAVDTICFLFSSSFPRTLVRVYEVDIGIVQ